MTLPSAIRSSEFELFGVVLHCHVLDNGERVIDAEDVVALFRSMEDSPAPETRDFDEAMAAFAKWMHGR